MRKWILFLVVLALAGGAAYYYWKYLREEKGGEIRRTVLGSEFRITAANFDPEDQVLRLDGHWEGVRPPDHYLIRATVGDSPDGPGTGGVFWYPGQDPAGQQFRLEFPSLPASAGKLFTHLYFADKRQAFSLAAETSFEIPNTISPEPRGLKAQPLPQSREEGGLEVTLLQLRTGGNFAPENRYPQWFSNVAFSVSGQGKPTDDWRLMELRLVPNIGTPIHSELGIPPTVGGRVTASVSGTLWKQDGPYEVQADFFRTTNVPPEDTFKLKDIRVPEAGDYAAFARFWSCPGVQIKFTGLYGPGAKLPPTLSRDTADLHTLVFSVETTEDVWIKLTQVSIGGVVRPVEEYRHADGRAVLLAIPLGNMTGAGRVDFDLSLLREKRQFIFVAEPSKD